MERLRLIVIIVVVMLGFLTPAVYAQYNSTNYSANEIFFGSGGDNGQTSSNYQATASIGALGVGSGTSAHYQAYSGFLTPGDPFLDMGIDSSAVNLGALSTGATATGTAAFHVRAYVDSGYTVQILSPPPQSNGPVVHTLSAMTSVGSAATGTEQFGINLVGSNNTGTGNFGSNPVPFPDSTFASGSAATGYNTVNQFKYNVPDIIAQSSGSGWGLTNYTISYIADIANNSPAGSYTTTQDLVVVATF
jgi:hypothetical protein